MSKAASTKDIPVEPTPEAAPAEPEFVPGPHEYTGPDRRTYADVPVTVEPGDVVDLAVPLDGWWRPTDKPVTKRPDNAEEE